MTFPLWLFKAQDYRALANYLMAVYHLAMVICTFHAMA